MELEFLITDKRLYKMQQEIFSSSELHSTFPRYKTSEDYGSSRRNSSNDSSSSNIIIPNLILPLCKYSSTETELSSVEDGYCYGEDSAKLSEFSASASSTAAGASGRKRQRKRKKKINGRLSASIQSLHSNGSNASYESRGGGTGRSLFLALNSVRDLKHAVGRHRGVSGSDVPSIDAAIFGMFYMTDVFDSLLLDEQLLPPSPFSRRNSTILGASIRALLKKEIVYSLRVNYYCPANKITKLIQLLEEHSSIDKMRDIPTFLKILCGDILKVSPFLKYSTGSAGYLLPLLVEPRIRGSNNYQQVHTLQHLLNYEFSSEVSSGSSGSGKLFRGDKMKFLTVPYPALIIEVIRTEDVTLSSSPSAFNNHEPVIPNMELDISAFISSGGFVNNNPTPSFYKSCNSITNSFMSSASAASFTSGGERRSFHYEYDQEDPAPKESRLVKGFKSAWKVMFQYLEDFTSSTHISPDSIIVDGGGDGRGGTISNVTRNLDAEDRRNNDQVDSNNQPLWYLIPPPQQEGRTSSRSSSISGGKNQLFYSSTSTPIPTAPVRMELIAVICMSKESESYLSVNHRNCNRDKHSSSLYSVYCKAGKDQMHGNNNAGVVEYAPWVLYQPQRGVAPQVTLIENCGKWISSLESKSNSENLTLYNIPLEIRRIVTDSSLFIYRKVDG